MLWKSRRIPMDGPNRDAASFIVQVLSEKENASGKVVRQCVHAEATVTLAERLELSRQFLKRLSALEARTFSVPAETAYDALHRLRGALYQKLQPEFLVSFDNTVLEGSALVGESENGYFSLPGMRLFTYPALGEHAAQLHALQARIATKNVKIPVSIKNVSFYEDTCAEGPHVIQVRQTAASEDRCVADIDIANRDGLIVARYVGCELQRKFTQHDNARLEAVLASHEIPRKTEAGTDAVTGAPSPAFPLLGRNAIFSHDGSELWIGTVTDPEFASLFERSHFWRLSADAWRSNYGVKLRSNNGLLQRHIASRRLRDWD